MLERVINRLSARAAHDPASQPKPGGHGDHWGCIMRATDQDDLLSFISGVIREAERPEMFHAAGPAMAVQSPGEEVRARILVVNDKLVSAYPEAESGNSWPIVVKEVIPWANGIEGQIIGTCYNAEVRFFDTKFYANHRKYTLGETYKFQMSAFAYTLGRAPETEVESDMGAKISLSGAHAFMPADVGNDTADIDDYWFHSPLESEVSSVTLAGRRLRAYPVILALPEDFPMSLTVFAADHVLAPDMTGIQPGDDLEGFIWLQGRRA